LTKEDRETIQLEIIDLEAFRDLAVSITENSKGKSLIQALKARFSKAEALGANKKAIIFTESRRTQNYLVRVLSETEHQGKIVLFNGSNTDDQSKQIYQQWYERHQGSDRISGSKSADMRSALVDYFKEEAHIMIATEAAAEGINLQFCSLVVNYELPWNPQRIEQRIVRCHRYGQKHDVVVVNFLNRNNLHSRFIVTRRAEQRP
jgi:adenine-specific DNA-methyltransferase